jgi:hypothetical protein
VSKLKSQKKLPKSLKVLVCNNNSLESISKLPRNLEEIYCSDNRITYIDILPSKIINLSCGNNLLCKLPKLNGKIRSIYCSNNQIETLDHLPNSLEIISAFDNRINKLQNFPFRGKFMILNNNVIESLPSIPSAFKCGQVTLEIANNGIQELNVDFEQFNKLDLRGNPICDTEKDYNQWYANLVENRIKSRQISRLQEYKYDLLEVSLHPSRIGECMDIESMQNIQLNFKF